MSQYPYRLLVITTGLRQTKSPQPHSGGSRLTLSLIAALAGLQIPFRYTESHILGEEMVASYLYLAGSKGYGRFLADNDF